MLKRKKTLSVFFAVVIILALTFSMVPTNVFASSAMVNPIGNDGADPWVIYQGGYYYGTVTTGSNVKIWKSQRLQDLFYTTPVTIWTPPSNPTPEEKKYSSGIWAPEFHYLDGRWYVYFAADDGDNVNHRMYVLEGGTDANDPLNGTYTYKGKIADSTDRWAIDGTPFVYNNTKYFVWSGWEGTTNDRQIIYIATMSNPWTISGNRVEISRPDYDWERIGYPHVNEGPQVLMKNGKVHVIYSASGSWTDDYCLGQITFSSGNILSKNSWVKNSTPVFAKTSEVFGPGHCSFVKSPNGSEDWIVYHAAKYAGSGWDRNLRAQKFGWSGDYPNFGTPIAPGISMPEPAGTPSSTIPIGKTIWLKAKANGNYVCADRDYANAPLLARSGAAYSWEKFEVHDAGDGYIALKALSNSLYVTANKDVTNAPLQAKASNYQDWEKFEWIDLGGGYIALKAKANGMYVTANNDATSTPLQAKGGWIKNWEMFTWGE